MKQSGFTLIELLVVIVIMSILSGLGVTSYYKYTANAKDKVAKKNYETIKESMELEFARCELNKKAKIFNSHNCNSGNSPTVNTINNYVNNSLKLKNPYDNKQQVAQSNICNSGSVVIAKKETGSYNVSYASVTKKEKYTSTVSSKWSSNYSKTNTTSVSFACASASGSSSTAVAKQTIYNYKPPNNGPGAGIIVDENGNMIKGGAGTSGAHACGANCFQANSKGMKNWYTTDANGNKIYPNRAGSKYRFVMTEAANPKTGNIASSCNRNNCKYNFSNNTYTVLNSGVTYKAGETVANRKPINP